MIALSTYRRGVGLLLLMLFCAVLTAKEAHDLFGHRHDEEESPRHHHEAERPHLEAEAAHAHACLLCTFHLNLLNPADHAPTILAALAPRCAGIALTPAGPFEGERRLVRQRGPPPVC